MALDSRVIDLLVQFEDHQAEGRPITPETLCQDCPELLDQVRQHVAILDSINTKLASRSNFASAPLNAPRVGGPIATMPPWHRFRKVQFHARGGLGEVYLGRDEELHREVALKRLPENRQDDASRRRFLREAEITSRLEHPGVVPVYGLGNDAEGQPCYAMRFIRGQTMHDAITELHAQAVHTDHQFPLALRQLLTRFTSVCQTVAYAHHQGVIHRDLKPSNILLGPFGETLVVDWGLAKYVANSVSHTEEIADDTHISSVMGNPLPSAATITDDGHVLGTPSFMSPEQAAGRWKDVGPATDIYSLGATLYALLTGTSPFPETNPAGLLTQIQEGQFSPPQKRNRNTPRALDAICRKAMALRPEDRYGTAQDLARDVERYLADEPVSAFREPWQIRSARWLRNHRTVVRTAAAMLVVIFAVLTIGLIAVARRDLRLDQKNIELEGALNREASERERADRSARDASESEADTEAAFRFLKEDVLMEARPREREGGFGATLTIKEALDDAAANVARTFAKRPRAEAKTRASLGLTYLCFGDHATAIDQLRRAEELFRTLYGPDHPTAIESLEILAEAYRIAGNIDQALPLGEEALRRCEKLRGFDHRETLMVANNLALIYMAASKPDKAMPLCAETLAKRTTKLGPDHPDTLESMSNLALMHLYNGQPNQALSLYEETLTKRRLKLGRDHRDTLMTMVHLALAYQAAGQLDKAVPLFEEALSRQQLRFGSDDPDTLGIMANLGKAYLENKQPAKALPLLSAYLAEQKKQFKGDSGHLAGSQALVGAALLKYGQPAEAEAVLRECLDLRNQNEPDAWSTYATKSLLGEALLNQQKFAESEPLLLEGYEGLKARAGDVPMRAKNNLPDATERLVKLYDAWGKVEDAARWRRVLGESRTWNRTDK